jgi:hypothetical protein
MAPQAFSKKQRVKHWDGLAVDDLDRLHLDYNLWRHFFESRT